MYHEETKQIRVPSELISWGVWGVLEAPSVGLGAQSQKVLKFPILMTSRGPSFDHSGVKYDLLKNFLKPNLRM